MMRSETLLLSTIFSEALNTASSLMCFGYRRAGTYGLKGTIFSLMGRLLILQISWIMSSVLLGFGFVF
jgi:hypothetical protein